MLETPSSQASAGFALRILRGWHAGAQIVLLPGETLRVGGGDDCDIILSDDEVAHLTLQVRLHQASDGRVTGWQMRQQMSDASSAWPATADDGDRDAANDANDANDADDAVTPFDTSIPIGELTLTVSRADADWPAVSLPDTPTPLRPENGTTLSRDAATFAETGGTIGTESATQQSTPEGDSARQSANVDAEGRDVSTEASEQNAMDPSTRPGMPNARSASPGAALRVKEEAASTPPSRGLSGTWQKIREGLPTRWLMAAGVLAIVATLVALIRVVPRPVPPTPPPIPVVVADSLTQTRHALRSGGWIDGIRADRDAQGSIVVSGWVADEAARDRLSAALARLTPMPAMRIDIIADAIQAARDTAAQFGPFLSVDANTVGELRIRGVILPPDDSDAHASTPPSAIAAADVAPPATLSATSESSASAAPPSAASLVPASPGIHDDPVLAALRTSLRAAIAAAVPNAALNDAALLTADGAVQALQKAQADVGLPKASIQWERIKPGSSSVAQVATTQGFGQLVLDAPAGTDIPRLQHMLDGFRQRYGDRIPLHALIAGSRATFAPALLPFAIVSISSGPLPSVVVDGNVRLLPGGTYHGFRLIHVDDASVVFDREPAAVQHTTQTALAGGGASRAPSAPQRIVLQR